MTDRKRWMRAMEPGLRVFAVLAMVVTGWFGAVAPGAAQASGASNVAIVTTENGQPFYDACFVLVNYSNVGCDENRDGKITFQDVPFGTYTLRQTRDLGAGRSVPDTTITVAGAMASDGWERFYTNVVSSGGSSQPSGPRGYSDVAIWTSENGQPAYDACFVLVGYSNEGCDENRDGRVMFADIPWGTYTVTQTRDLGSGRWVDDFTIEVRGNINSAGFESFNAVVSTSTGGSVTQPGGAVDIALITREPQNGRLLTGTCYVLVGYSNVGCDENGDGQVTFAAIPYGSYTVRQTQTPTGYPTINDYTINVQSSLGAPLGFLVRQAQEQNAPNTRNVSVVFIDSGTGARVVTDICAQFVNASNVGCDEDLRDGQIDFLDVAAGTHEIRYSNIPAGWQVLTGGQGASTVTINAGAGSPTHQMIFVQVSSTGGAGTGNATADTGAIAVIGGSQPGSTSSGSSSPGTTSDGVAVELILDTSGSMNERDQGTQTRLDVAKTVTTRLVTETLPAGVPMALRTYSGCSSSLTIPMQPLDPNAAATTINGLSASGQTPIGQSLRAAAADLANVSGPKIIVLVTDGEETCGGNPRGAIEALVAQDVSIQVNIVGFAIDDATLTATFQEWARVGKGSYYQASNALELDQAVTMASQLSFMVMTQQGTVVATGVVGGDAVPVPAGTYTVEANTVPVTRHENVVVTARETTTIDLNTSGTGGSGDGLIVPSNSPGSSGSVDATQPTWTASVQVSICDSPDGANCRGEGGTIVSISLATGEFIGSCTVGDPQPTPWGITISLCTVDGLPFNADFVATQDPATIPAGYVPISNLAFFSIGNETQGGGDQATFSFTNVPIDTGIDDRTGTQRDA